MTEEDIVLGRRCRVRRRKPVGAIFAFRLTSDLLARLDEEARRRDCTMSEVIRDACEHYLAPSVTLASSSAITWTIEP